MGSAAFAAHLPFFSKAAQEAEVLACPYPNCCLCSADSSSAPQAEVVEVPLQLFPSSPPLPQP